MATTANIGKHMRVLAADGTDLGTVDEVGADHLKLTRSGSPALAAKGVAKDRLSAATGGESNPVAPNSTAQGRFENRRTELVVTAR